MGIKEIKLSNYNLYLEHADSIVFLMCHASHHFFSMVAGQYVSSNTVSGGLSLVECGSEDEEQAVKNISPTGLINIRVIQFLCCLHGASIFKSP